MLREKRPRRKHQPQYAANESQDNAQHAYHPCQVDERGLPPVMGGLEATARIRAEHPEAKVLVLTMSDERSDVLGAMAEEVAGYIVKDDPSEEFVRAVRLVARGGSYVSPRPNLRRNESKPWDAFSDRDREMLRMVAEGKGDKEIGEAVYLAQRTVKHRLGEMRRALGAENRTHLAVIAIREKILRLPDG